MNKKIGAQFYTICSRIKTLKDFDDACKKVKDMGFEIIQISGVNLEAKDMKPIIDKYGLKVVLTHLGYDKFVNDIDGVIEYNKTLGSDFCGLGMMPTQLAESNDGVSEFIEKINKACETLKKEDLYFGYHNHAYEFAENDGKRVFDRLLNETDKEVFNFIVDTYWLQVGGMNPIKVINELGKRAMAVHFKDYIVKMPEWKVPRYCEVGAGNLDWDGILEACDKAGVEHYLIELDSLWIDDDPFLSLKKSREFLVKKGLR